MGSSLKPKLVVGQDSNLGHSGKSGLVCHCHTVPRWPWACHAGPDFQRGLCTWWRCSKSQVLGISWSPHLSSSTSSQHTRLTKQSSLQHIKFCYVGVAVMKETEIRYNQLLFCKASLNQGQLGSQVVYLQSLTVVSHQEACGVVE